MYPSAEVTGVVSTSKTGTLHLAYHRFSKTIVLLVRISLLPSKTFMQLFVCDKRLRGQKHKFLLPQGKVFTTVNLVTGIFRLFR